MLWIQTAEEGIKSYAEDRAPGVEGSGQGEGWGGAKVGQPDRAATTLPACCPVKENSAPPHPWCHSW